METKSVRVLSNGTLAGYVKQSDGTWKWRFIGTKNKLKGGTKNKLKGGTKN